jgi:LysR family transcriptional regulator, nitrogen assimilation regulatory protein
MQFRQLRYFVKIVEAGSFSRAATLIHVAQPALSQQIHELEDRLGVMLLQRSARGVSPTAAGEVLFREATSILHQLDQLPTVVRSTSGEAEGAVKVGLASSTAPILIGPLLERVKTTLPKVNLKISDDDSGTLQAGVAASSFDLAVVYEDEFLPSLSRRPIFRQRLYFVGSQPFYVEDASSVSLEQIAKLPLILPGLPNGRRSLIDRAFGERGLAANVVAEADTLSSELLAVRSGVAGTILPISDRATFERGGFAAPLLVEPALFLTCSVISSSDFPLTHAGEAVREILIELLRVRLRDAGLLGVEWID